MREIILTAILVVMALATIVFSNAPAKDGARPAATATATAGTP